MGRHFKSELECGLVTADLTTTVVQSYKLLMNDVTHSLYTTHDYIMLSNGRRKLDHVFIFCVFV